MKRVFSMSFLLSVWCFYAHAEPSAAARVWEVQALRYGAGLVCEAHMRGRNEDGGGSYMVRMLVIGSTPTLVIEHEGGVFPVSAKAVITINNEFKVMAKEVTQNLWAGHIAFQITMGYDDFTQKFIPNLEDNLTKTAEITIGTQKYIMITQGFRQVSETMHKCNSALPHLR